MHDTSDPSIADVIAAIGGFQVDLTDPFVILGAPEVDGLCAGICQTLASGESSDRCEIRLFKVRGKRIAKRPLSQRFSLDFRYLNGRTIATSKGTDCIRRESEIIYFRGG